MKSFKSLIQFLDVQIIILINFSPNCKQRSTKPKNTQQNMKEEKTSKAVKSRNPLGKYQLNPRLN